MRRLHLSFLLLVLALPAMAQEKVLELAPVQKLLQDRCSACHDWAASLEGAASMVTPGKPEESSLWQSISAGRMPPEGPLSDEEQKLLRSWIEVGAPTRPAPTAEAPSAQAGEPASGATEGAAAVDATTQATPATSPRFLGFRSKVAFHQASGFTSAALFGAAGILGAVQWATLVSASHGYRDAHDIDEETMSPVCNDYIAAIWRAPEHQALRWTHVGLLSAGEALYLADAVTGIGMLTKDRPGLTAADLHRYAFFTHGALMISELILGALTTTLLSQGNHWTMVAVGVAHTAVGFAIPLIMTGAGIAVNTGFPRR
jgi:hypothetical protein